MDEIVQVPTDLPPIISPDDFRHLVYKDADFDPSSYGVFRDFGGDQVTVKQTSNSGEFEFVASTESVDRDKDTIRAKGFDLKAYLKAPVWLAFHDPREFIGVATKAEVEGDRLLNTLKLGPGKMAAFVGDVIRFRLETKALKDAGASCSVGYLPIKFQRAPEDSGRSFGIDFIKQELLETSFVAIGSNRDALLRAKAAGIDHTVVGDWAERYRRRATGVLLVSVATAESIVKALDPSKGLALFEMGPEEIAKTYPESPDGTVAGKTAKEDAADTRHKELVASVASLVKALAVTAKEKADESPLPEVEPSPEAYAKLAADYISLRAEDEIIRRTGAIPSS